MVLQVDLLTKLAQLNAQAELSNKDKSMLAELIAPLTAAIDAYYNLAGVESGVRNCILALTHGQIRAGIEYEDGSKAALDTSNAPIGYSDITDLFNIGNDILDTKDAVYINSIELVQVMGDDGVTVVTEHYESDLVDAWIAKFAAELAEETGLLSKLRTVAAFANSAMVDPVKFLTEPAKMTVLPDLTVICKDIYFNRKYLELINGWDLGIYIPSVCR